MSRAAGRKAKPVEQQSTQPQPLESMSVREWSVAIIELAISDWETANHNLPRTSREWKDAAWFFVRRMKAHPKLISATPIQAAGVMQQLWEQVEQVQDFFLRENMGVEDVVMFVQRRWSGIKFLAGENPLEAALKLTKSKPIEFDLPWRVWAAIQDARQPSEDDLADTRMKKFSVPWNDLHPFPMMGLFVGMIWNLYKMLLQHGEDPIVILPCDTISELLKVSSKTVWDYRCNLEKRRTIIKLPRKGPADRYKIDPIPYAAVMANYAVGAESARKNMRGISID